MRRAKQKIQKNKVNKKVLAITFAVLFILILVIFIYKNEKEKQELEKIKEYSSIEQFKTLEEVAKYMDCKFEKQETSKTDNYKIDVYMNIKVSPIDGKSIYKRYYENLLLYCAQVLEYQNFILIDKSKELTILVNCNRENKTILNYYINGDSNYFEKQETYKQIESFEKVGNTKINIESEILNKVIKNRWEIKNSEIGTMESNFENYNIFLDEGLEIRKVNGKIFNIIFTKNYNKNIINNLSVNSTEQEIIESLGKPSFKDENYNLIGYKSEEIYVFFNLENNQISIYRNQIDFKTEKIANYISKYTENKDLKTFIMNIKNEWKDYDVYEYDFDYVLLQYTLKGLQVMININNQTGIFLYNNYEGKITNDIEIEQIINKAAQLPEDIYIQNKDLVYEAEIQRLTKKENLKSLVNNNKSILNFSNKFKIYSEAIHDGAFKIQIISNNEKYASSELREYIDYGIWYDDFNFIYSVSKKGIYNYNLETQKYTTITTGTKEKFEIKNIENNLLKYDDTQVVLDI